ncbi:RICIN domain-containing protein [Streptosporangium sp. CA-135522]|uniref:RICIN domain-containing protein n=1 Tax=Streptosporangium sp. CA-135522 TaxID=3240072 RepID=UPI003D8CDEDF
MSDKRRLVAVAVTALLTLLVTTMLAGPARASALQPTPIKNWANGKCIETSASDIRVYLSSCNGLGIQAWNEEFLALHDGTACCFEFSDWVTGRCLTEAFGTESLGIELQPCIGDLGFNSHQLWRVWYAFNPPLPETRGWFQQLQNVKTGRCLTLNDNSSANGTPIIPAPCDPSHTSPAQRWKI